MDIIPEAVHGPYGYIDDIFITVYVLRTIADKHGYDFLQKIYKGHENIEDVMDECMDHAFEALEDNEMNAILSYVGLSKNK